MGCDIHMYLETKRVVNGKNEWVSADLYEKNRYYEPNNKWEKEYNIVNIYNDRDYSLFSVLADVRNYGNNKPIDIPRGIPDDCCKEIKEEYKIWRN